MRARWFDEPFVGREDLIEELVAASEAVASGGGAIFVLAGEAGIGKSTVVRTLVRRAPGTLRVSWGACVADQSAPPFCPWQPFLEVEVPDHGRSSDATIGAARYERLTVLRDRARELAAAQPRLHVIEDLQWSDVASALLLAHVGAIIVDAPLLIVATLRTGEPLSRELAGALEEVRRNARVHDLRTFDDRDIAALLSRGGAAPDDDLVALVRERTGGNPLLVSELLRALPALDSADRHMEVLAETVPARVSELVAQRLRRMSAPVADALIGASVIGPDGDVATLAAAHGCDTASLLDLLDQARAAYLLDAAEAGRWRFRHALIRDAVYESIAAGERARRHARVIEALAADPSTSASTLAHHALAAQPIFDADRAVALAARAGQSAFDHHAYEDAIAWFARALAAAPPDTSARWRAELLVLCGEAHRHIGNVGAAREAFLEASALTDEPELIARAALGYADQGADLGIAYRSNDTVTGSLIDRAIAAQPSLDTLTGVQLEARLAAELYFSDVSVRARELARSALTRARRLGDTRALGTATAVAHDAFVVGQADLEEQLRESAQLLEWARTSRSVSAMLTARRARVIDLLSAGDLAAMDAEVIAFRRLAEPLSAPGYAWWPALWSAMRALLEGRHEVAAERALAAYQVGEQPFPSLAFLNLAFLMFFLRREQGCLAEMEQATREFAAANADMPATQVALTLLLAEVGKIDEARDSLARFDETALVHMHDRNWPASWFQLARAAFLVGDVPLAAALLEPHNRPSEPCVQVSLATVCLGATDLARAWLLQTGGDLDGADGSYRTAAVLNARIGARSWLAQTRADHASLLLVRDRAGDRDEAAELHDLAHAAAREIGLATVTAYQPRRTSISPRATPATFRRNGAVWELGFAGRAVQLPDARGLRDLSYLLARPGEAVSVLELAHDSGASSASARGAPALDERARREIRARLRELDDDEAEAEAAGDDRGAARAREERQALAEAVARDLGLGGRARLVDDPVERARKTVSTRIRRAIGAVGRAHPELGRHLERSIDTGAWCAYRPAEPIHWQT